MANYNNLSKNLTRIISEEKKNGSFTRFGFDESKAVRRIENPHDEANVWRTAFIRDVDKILNCPFYNRYADKTQVLSFYKNDDITHRSLHVQLVSRIARTIGSALNLNLDLIEAIALGHDLGHTPFGHTGERFLDQISKDKTGKRFSHNVHSVRVLDKIFPLNVTLQTLSGILSHNGELELIEYRPKPFSDFKVLDQDLEKCYADINHNLKLVPSTLEGCVVRIADIIAYIGKDRQDAEKQGIASHSLFADYGIGSINAEIINNLLVNIIENSYSKPYIKMDENVFTALSKCKKENYDLIYNNPSVTKKERTVLSMMEKIYQKLLDDLVSFNQSSPIFTHHINYINKPYYKRETPYIETEKNQIVIDYIASMTDDYFIDLFNYLFPNSSLKIEYKGYFDD